MPPPLAVPGLSRPSDNFQAVRDGRRAEFNYLDVDLSTARSLAASPASALKLDITGNFLYVDQRMNTGFATVRFNEQTPFAAPITIFGGSLWKSPFTSIFLENSAQPNQTLRLIWGTDLDALPISATGVSILNSVSIVDGGKVRTLAGQAFLGSAGVGPIAAQFSHAQLRMPAGTGKRAVLRQVIAGSTVAGVLQLQRFDTALATFLQNAPSKNIGSADSSAEQRIETNVGQLGTGGLIAQELVQANVTAPPLVLAEPLVIHPGQGVLLRQNVANTQLWTVWEFYEEPDV
jgi:hypothetical protein